MLAASLSVSFTLTISFTLIVLFSKPLTRWLNASGPCLVLDESPPMPSLHTNHSPVETSNQSVHQQLTVQ